jgi:hypothetical protein
MGERTVAQEALFYKFSLERHVPADHLLRSIDRFVDLSGIREQLRSFYSEGGRPSVNPELIFRYRASKPDCQGCALKPRCCPKADACKVMRSVHEGARDLARTITKEEEWLVSRRERKKVEMLFAHLKRILRLDRIRLRGPNGARDEFHLAAAAQTFASWPS